MSGADCSGRVFAGAPGGKLMRDQADYVVIGTGPSGATAAKVLSEAGHDVIMIEEGRWVKTEEFDGTAFTVQKHCYREMGTISAMGKAVIPIIQGRCVGGGSVINAAIIWRLPQDVFGRWVEEFKIAGSVTWPELEESFDILERDLNVKPVSPDALGRNNALLKQGADKLNIESRIILRNEKGCQGYAQCLTGCPIKAKQSTDLTYIPEALERGARLYSACQAVHLDVKAGRATAVHGTFRDPLTRKPRGRLAAHAKKGVVICASPIQTPLLLMSSGLGLASGHLGRHLTGHPGAGVIAVYPEEVRIWEGATQGWDSEHFRQTHKVKFEALSVTPDILAGRLPGSGAEFMRAMTEYDRIGEVGCALVSPTEGTVRSIAGMALITYSLTPQDYERLRFGIKTIAEIMAAAGATTIMPGIHGAPARITPGQIKLIEQAPIKPSSYTMAMTHLFGTCRMGPDPKTSVTGLDFQLHDTKGVYVLDSSVFPTNLGVNPQHTIMGMAMAGAKRIAAS